MTVHITPYAGRETPPRAWRRADDAILRAFVVLGRSSADASRALGRSKNACLSRASRLGLRFTAPAGSRKG